MIVILHLYETAETDGPPSKQTDQTGSESRSSSREEKYKDRGSAEREERGKGKQREEEEDKDSGVVIKTAKSSEALMSPRRNVGRKHSSPPAPDIMILRRSVSPSEEVGKPRPLSYCLVESDANSKSVTPQHRKLLANMASCSPKQERPRVS